MALGIKGGPVRLAADTGYLGSRSATSGVPVQEATSSDVSTTSYANILSLTGKYVLGLLELRTSGAADQLKIKLTIDGVEVWAETTVTAISNEIPLWGSIRSATVWTPPPFVCDSSFVLEGKDSDDASVEVYYQAHKIA